jgi:hypothetical protein
MSTVALPTAAVHQAQDLIFIVTNASACDISM